MLFKTLVSKGKAQQINDAYTEVFAKVVGDLIDLEPAHIVNTAFPRLYRADMTIQRLKYLFATKSPELAKELENYELITIEIKTV